MGAELMKRYQVLMKYLAASPIISLVALAAVCGTLISTLNAVTRSTIDQNQQTYARKQLRAILGDPAENIIKLSDGLYYTERANSFSGFIFQHSTHEGYNGTIKSWIAVSPDHVIRGVRVFEHHETPGIGDKIEIGVSDWIKHFDHKSLTQSTWSLARDGGSFDHFSGATITSRALVKSVESGLTKARDKAAQWTELAENNSDYHHD
jgi:electron transport complex protein RnfG